MFLTSCQYPNRRVMLGWFSYEWILISFLWSYFSQSYLSRSLRTIFKATTVLDGLKRHKCTFPYSPFPIIFIKVKLSIERSFRLNLTLLTFNFFFEKDGFFLCLILKIGVVLLLKASFLERLWYLDRNWLSLFLEFYLLLIFCFIFSIT